METGYWKQCFLCRKPTAMEDLRGRQAVVQVTSYHNWLLGFSPFHYRTYSLVDVCPICDRQEEEAYHTRRYRVGLLIAGGGLGLFGWGYLGMSGLVGAGVVLLLGVFVSRRKKTTLLPVERTQL